jgi:integrase/recombinase XerD
VLAGLRFFYSEIVARDWQAIKVAKPRYDKTLPLVLSREEVWRILDCVRKDVYRVCLTTIYSCGLRLLEGCSLQVADVDTAGGVLRIHGKGLRHRDVPLPSETLRLRSRQEVCKRPQATASWSWLSCCSSTTRMPLT